MISGWIVAQSYAPQAGSPGSTAIFKNSPLYVGWATGVDVQRGPLQKSNPDFAINGNSFASAGTPQNALGFPDGNTVSLGDGGSATLTFAAPIGDETGFDFAVFENGGASYLELAFVEASSDGIHFFRFPAHSQTQTVTQLGTFGTPEATYLNNLAGKYSGEYGTPFDLAELPNDPLLDKSRVTHIRIVDVVGSIDPLYATFDSFGNAVNDSFPTPFISCGFDLQAVGVLHQQTLDVDQFSEVAFALYPNPARHEFYIHLKETASVSLFDASGRLIVNQTTVANQPIAIGTLNPGVYLVKIEYNHHQITKPLIIH